jgi:hypothetical protein
VCTSDGGDYDMGRIALGEQNSAVAEQFMAAIG